MQDSCQVQKLKSIIKYYYSAKLIVRTNKFAENAK